MLIIFGRNNHWISRLIRWRTQSQWSHVGILDGDNVIEARGSVGVVLTPIYEFVHRYTHTETRAMAGDASKAKALIGKPFDLHGLWGLFFMFPELQCKDAWFCSEVVALAADCFEDDKAFNVTPADVYNNSTFIH